jgi:hypothetical protein
MSEKVEVILISNAKIFHSIPILGCLNEMQSLIYLPLWRPCCNLMDVQGATGSLLLLAYECTAEGKLLVPI